MRKLLSVLYMLLGLSVSTISAKSVSPRVWHHPSAEVNYNNHDGYFNSIISPERVEFLPEKTIVDMEVIFRPDSWFTISSGTVLNAADKTYSLIEAEGIELDKKTYCQPSGRKSFRLIFEPLPLDTKKFDFKGSDAYHIKGISDPVVTARQLLPSTWRNERTGDWEIGLFDEGVVYDAKFWNYVSASRPADNGSFEMTDGEQTLKVRIGKLKNGVRKIRIGDAPEAVCSMITSRILPDYPVADTRDSFKDNRYAVGDTAVLHGWLRNSPKRITHYTLSCKTPDSKYLEEVGACEVDSLGRFTMKIPLANTSECFMDWKNTHIRTVLEPGETYYMLYDFGRGQTLFMGSDCRLQNELMSYPPSWNKNRKHHDEIFKEEGADAFVEVVRRDLNADIQTLDTLCARHPTLSQRFRLYNEGNLYNQSAFEVGQTRSRSNGYRLSDTAVDFLNDIFRNHTYKPYLLHREYLYYINDLVEDEIHMKNPVAIGKYVSDSMSPDEAKNIVDMEYLRRGVKFLNSLGADDDAKSLWVTRKIADYFEDNHRSLSQDHEDFVKANIHIPVSLKAIQDKNEAYKALESRVKGSSPDWNVHSISVAEGMTDGKALLDSIVAPHKGKIVLLDVWGTWCGPCRQALAESQKEYAELAPYDMVYVYLANNSPENAWKTIIEEYNVKGDNVFHYNLPKDQQALIEAYLKVTSFPHYRLIDKEGNLLPFSVDARWLAPLRHILDKL